MYQSLHSLVLATINNKNNGKLNSKTKEHYSQDNGKNVLWPEMLQSMLVEKEFNIDNVSTYFTSIIVALCLFEIFFLCA